MGEDAIVPTGLLRVVGAVLLLLVVLPIYSLAPPGVPGSPAEHLRSLAASYYGALVFGGLVVALLSVALAFTRVPRRVGDAVASRLGALLVRPSGRAFALGAGLASGLLALLLSGFAFAFRPALLDATSQLVHARYLAAGRLAGPELELPEFFVFQYTVNLPTGWASQYPPGHVALLALGLAVGAPWLVGPVLVAATVFLVARVAERVLPGDVLSARVGTVILAASPFFLGHAASYMNHVTAAAFASLAVFGALQARGEGRGGYRWLALAGVATGLVFATRPLAGLVVGIVALAALYLAEPAAAGVRRWIRRVAVFGAGCLPPLAALGTFNGVLFGGPTRFGYLVAEGPGHGMGFHRDPWGNPYGPFDGVVQTSRDLLALGLDLLVTPLSAVVVVAVYLLLGANRSRALPLLLLWALLPVAANFFYWHQDLFMGPRLLTEFTPPWALLTALAVVGLTRRTRGGEAASGRRFDTHGAVAGALLLSGALAVALLIPQRIALYRSQWGPAARTPVPQVEEPALVFVQTSWAERLGARLAAHGLRVDSIRAALRHNTSCEVQEFLDAREAGRAVSRPPGAAPRPAPVAPERLHFRPRPGVAISETRLGGRIAVWTYPDERPTPECFRQVNADRRGALEFPELLWHGDLPGLGGSGAMFARDMGPELNRRLRELHPGRRPLVYLRPEPHLRPVLVPYDEGMDLLWRQPPPSAAPGAPE